ncbi:hypothetical protein C475_14933 [Halosimplex carlsbadense 2-9-1]|uniref:Uncharacterized protein n=1 Tax=Halosimplex carlsbadense 2-9-1 TaxID=797114 RepID=M0CK25_9EURY|nr:hypothetical protein [Halosimplex carlsbadense]ELZ23576.1 hypothetical protein C475_14933 [Halosimplex carlsbadense 2-9-1]
MTETPVPDGDGTVADDETTERDETESGVPPVKPEGYDVADPESREFGLRGWALVAALVVALVVIPWTIIGIPQVQGLLEALPLGYRDAYLVLPFVPAVFLGALGVWTALANRRP